VRTNEAGEREGFDTMRYTESEIRRIARTAFQAARKRSGRVCSVDKANVLETTQFWRDVVTESRTGIPTSRSRTCTSTTRRCSWCAIRSSST
jgi:isocitrate/isopropylmalate dehydrogenase